MMKRTVRAHSLRIDYELIQTSRSNMMLKVLPDGGVRLLVPSGTRLADADAMVAENILWIREKLDALRAKSVNAEKSLCDGASIRIEGEEKVLRVLQGPGRSEIAPREVRVYVAICDRTDQVRSALMALLIDRMKLRLRENLDRWAPRIGVRYNRVTIREQKTRWGSCSSKGNLNFNWKLIMAPPEALEYVVIHELCHLKELNHSPRFWALVRSQMPEYKVWVDYLKAHGGELGLN